MCDDLPFINTTQKTLKSSKKNVSMPRMVEKKLHTREFQLKGRKHEMQATSKKGLVEKQQSVPNTYAIFPSKRYFIRT